MQRIREGIPVEISARLHNVPIGVLAEWLQIGNGEHPSRRATARYKRFAQAIDQAEAESIASKVQDINKAIKGGKASAARWWLERRASSFFPSSRPGVTVMGDMPITLLKQIRGFQAEPDPEDPRVQLEREARERAQEPPALGPPPELQPAPASYEPNVIADARPGIIEMIATLPEPATPSPDAAPVATRV